MRAGGPAWRPGDPALSVGEIATRLAPIAHNRRAHQGDIKNTFSKVRHWSREGMMFPVAGIHAGNRQVAALFHRRSL